MSHPRKIGTVQTVDMETGEVVEEKANAFTMLPPASDVCQICAVDHAWNQPHNQQSLYYQYRFYGEHGRWPTWTDAMSHCAPEVQDAWRRDLVEKMRQHGLPIPADLQEPAGTPRSR
jgi:hypothetical protein